MPRPIFREPSPARAGSVLIGAGAGALWMVLFGFIGHTAQQYAWWSIGAGIAAWIVSLVLARIGDRGVAAGAALTSGVGVAIAFSVVMTHWVAGHWLLW
jgi:hypothetical protein